MSPTTYSNFTSFKKEKHRVTVGGIERSFEK